MSKAEMMEMVNLLKKYMEVGVLEQMEEAWANGDCMKSSDLSNARQYAYNLLKVIGE